MPTVTSAERPPGSSATSTMRATVADVAPDVAAADLAAPLDQHHAELGLAGEAVGDQGPVAGLEHVQREDGTRQEHRAEREHRQCAPSARGGQAGA